jgi:hypothetical protein
VALASTRNLDVIKTLLEAGAIANKDTMLNISRYDTGSDREIAFLLLRYASPEEICENIHNFIADGSRDMLDYCFTTFESASPNCTMRYNGMTPFLYAATGVNGERRSTEMVRYLLEKGADIEKPDAFGNSPLYLALYHGRVETATILLDHGAEACSGKDGKSLLYLAVIKGKVQDEDLLRRLADQVPLTGTMEEQSVQAACYSGNVSVLSILLARGATLRPGVIYEVGEKVPGKEKMRAFLAAKGLKTTAEDTDDNQ